MKNQGDVALFKEITWFLDTNAEVIPGLVLFIGTSSLTLNFD